MTFCNCNQTKNIATGIYQTEKSLIGAYESQIAILFETLTYKNAFEEAMFVFWNYVTKLILFHATKLNSDLPICKFVLAHNGVFHRQFLFCSDTVTLCCITFLPAGFYKFVTVF